MSCRMADRTARLRIGLERASFPAPLASSAVLRFDLTRAFTIHLSRQAFSPAASDS
jgi:hypothetical protein